MRQQGVKEAQCLRARFHWRYINAYMTKNYSWPRNACTFIDKRRASAVLRFCGLAQAGEVTIPPHPATNVLSGHCPAAPMKYVDAESAELRCSGALQQIAKAAPVECVCPLPDQESDGHVQPCRTAPPRNPRQDFAPQGRWCSTCAATAHQAWTNWPDRAAVHCVQQSILVEHEINPSRSPAKAVQQAGAERRPNSGTTCKTR